MGALTTVLVEALPSILTTAVASIITFIFTKRKYDVGIAKDKLEVNSTAINNIMNAWEGLMRVYESTINKLNDIIEKQNQTIEKLNTIIENQNERILKLEDRVSDLSDIICTDLSCQLRKINFSAVILKED